MIQNAEFTVPMLTRLSQHPHHTFYLTGSRYFGGYTQCSDWDFFVEHSEDIINWLTSLDFKICIDTQYKDQSVQMIMKYRDEEIKIDIQLVTNAQLKNEVQEGLPKELMRKSPHDIRHLYWNYALSAVAR